MLTQTENAQEYVCGRRIYNVEPLTYGPYPSRSVLSFGNLLDSLQQSHQLLGTQATRPELGFERISETGFVAVPPERVWNLWLALENLRSLPSNWDSYGAEPPDERSLSSAGFLLSRFAATECMPSRLIPSAEGGVALVFEEPGKYADIECFNDGDIVAAICPDRTEPFIWEVLDGYEEEAISRIDSFFHLLRLLSLETIRAGRSRFFRRGETFSTV
jgi:hypothetical protein